MGINAYAVAKGQAWISFVEDPTRIQADPSVIADLPCDATCTGGCSDWLGCECACEKDMAVGDLDGTEPFRDELIIVRKQPQYALGGVSNLLFVNESGTMVDRTTNLAPCFADPTEDRDVKIIDINDDDNFDVITATTFGDHPRVYINLGSDANGWRGLCLCYDKETDTCHDASYLSTHSVCYQDAANNCFVDIPALSDDQRIAEFSPGPFFCSVAVGDLNGDNCIDLYFVDYDNTLEDRLLFNTKTGGVCTGFFTDVTQTPSTRLCPNGPPCFNESAFGTGAKIVDVDRDGLKDIVKGEDTKLSVLYNNAANAGNFNVKHDLHVEFPDISDAYMFDAEDINIDLSIDIYVVESTQDCFLINTCVDPQSAACDRGDGTVAFLDPYCLHLDFGTVEVLARRLGPLRAKLYLKERESKVAHPHARSVL